MPLRKPVILTCYVDANLMHCMLTGRSVASMIYFINGTTTDTFSKKQSTVETTTYGSKFVAAKTCVEQVIDIQTILRYLGVPTIEHSEMFGDNNAVVSSSMDFDGNLHKRHIVLSFHCVREAIAASICQFTFIPTDKNLADILSKHWSYGCVWRLLRLLLFWHGDTADIFKQEE